MTAQREAVEQVQQEIKKKWSGKYAALCRRLGPDWYKQRLSRVLSSKSPPVVEFLTVATVAGVSLAPFLQRMQ